LRHGEFSSFDVLGSTFTNTTSIQARSDIVGRYPADGLSYGYLLAGGLISPITVPGATSTV
jgi:hypothetical protein